jgi:hypothetical protein
MKYLCVSDYDMAYIEVGKDGSSSAYKGRSTTSDAGHPLARCRASTT